MTLASDRSCAIPLMMACSKVASLTHVPEPWWKDDRTCIGMLYRRPTSTDRVIRTPAPDADNSSISSKETSSSFFGIGHDPRVTGEDPIDIGVDLADIAAQHRRQSYGGGIGAAPPDGRDFLRGRIDPLETGHDHNLARIQTLLDPVAPDLLDPGRTVGAVGEDPGLGARQADGLDAASVDRHRRQVPW